MTGGDSLTGASTLRRRVVFLTLGGAIMLAAAWLLAPNAGPPIAVMAAVFGWLVCWITRPAPPVALAPVPVAAPVPPAAVPPAVPPQPTRDPMSVLRHDLRGILSPALLMADRLLAHDDPAVKRAGEVIARTVERATARLEPPAPVSPAAPDSAP
jgi:hypothetical protein